VLDAAVREARRAVADCARPSTIGTPSCIAAASTALAPGWPAERSCPPSARCTSGSSSGFLLAEALDHVGRNDRRVAAHDEEVEIAVDRDRRRVAQLDAERHPRLDQLVPRIGLVGSRVGDRDQRHVHERELDAAGAWLARGAVEEDAPRDVDLLLAQDRRVVDRLDVREHEPEVVREQVLVFGDLLVDPAPAEQLHQVLRRVRSWRRLDGDRHVADARLERIVAAG
jgi:hypothetical protein